jgi:hypothetical protein
VVWNKSQGRVIREIVVDQARWESDELWEVIDSLSSFATLAHEQGGLRADEIAPEILWNSQVTYYYGQARQNGHYLYVGNSGWKAHNIEACRAGLMACDASEIAQIYKDLESLVPQVGYDISEWRSHYDTFRQSSPLHKDFDALNDRLYAVDHDSFLRRRIEWIKSLPQLEVVPTDAMQHRLERLFSANPLREERRAILLEEERRQAESFKREQSQRLSTVEARQHANKVLASLRRLFKNDPREVGVFFETISDNRIAWPISGDAYVGWYLALDTAKGIALLYGDDDIISGPKPLSEPARAYFADLTS